MVVLDGVALPFYVTERFVTPDFEEAMEYWPNYARHVIHSKGKPRSPQEYLLTLTKIVERAKVYDDNRTSERILQRVTEHFGLAQVTAWFQQVNQFRGIIK